MSTGAEIYLLYGTLTAQTLVVISEKSHRHHHHYHIGIQSEQVHEHHHSHQHDVHGKISTASI